MKSRFLSPPNTVLPPQRLAQFQHPAQIMVSQIYTPQYIQQMQLYLQYQQLHAQMQQAPLFPNVTSSPLIWFTWSDFALTQMQNPEWPVHEATNEIASKMAHSGSVFGLPIPPITQITQISASQEFKRSVASRLLDKYMAQAKVEAWERLKHKLEAEGEVALKSILNGDKIFGEVDG